MSPLHLSRRLLLQTGSVAAGVAATAVLPVSTAGAASRPVLPRRPDLGARASEFPLGRVRLRPGRWLQNQRRTIGYLRFVDLDRLLYTFRANHGLDTEGAEPCGGWEAPDFPFRTHSQGHFLTAWCQAYLTTGDTVCRAKATAMVAELARCQANDAAAGFNPGYLAGFPESAFDDLEGDGPKNVVYYAVHKTMAGLLDTWRMLGSTQARDVLLGMASWVDWRTARLTREHMQRVLGTEFGGMAAVLTDLGQMSGDERWLSVARRFDHAAVMDPLAEGEDRLSGLHANTQVPKWIGAVRQYQAGGGQRYLDVARFAWTTTTEHHSYVIGGNSEAEHFRGPDQIAAFLDGDTAEACNTYNMLKLTRELWRLEPDRAEYFDFYERALLNHLLGTQNPADPHGHVCYFTGTQPGARRAAVGPVWGGGSWSTDYGTFWCCQGTGVETHTKLVDSVYWHSGRTLTVNLFVPSSLVWDEAGVTLVQETAFPAEDTTTLRVERSDRARWTLRVRVPRWTRGATVEVNGRRQDVVTVPGTYASITRRWRQGDRVVVRTPMRVVLEAANDDPDVQAVTYGPVVLCGRYGDRDLARLPRLDPSSIRRARGRGLDFTATADGEQVRLGPFHDAHGVTYTLYWDTAGT